METPGFPSIELLPVRGDRVLSVSSPFRLWPTRRSQQTPRLPLSATPSSVASTASTPSPVASTASTPSPVAVPPSVTVQSSASTSSAHASSPSAAGMLARFRSFCARRCSYSVPLPRHVADVRRLLDVLFYEQLVFISISACLSTAHLAILVYTCTFEEPLKEPAPFLPILGVMLGLSVTTLGVRVRLVVNVRTLQHAWWHRPVLKDTVELLTSPLCQARRVLFVISFCVYFATLHLAYYNGGTGANSSTQAPVLLRYISIIVLAFLSLLGPHILLLACICTSFVLCLCSPPEHFEHLLIEEPRSGRALPKKFLQRMKEEKWLPASAYDAAERADTGLEEEGETERALGRVCFVSVFLCRCAICLCEFEENDWIRRLPCQHFFHSACIARWLRSHASCPLRCHVNFFTGEVYSSPVSCSVEPSSRPARVQRTRRAVVSRSRTAATHELRTGEVGRGHEASAVAQAAVSGEGTECAELAERYTAETRRRRAGLEETGQEEAREDRRAEQLALRMSDGGSSRQSAPGEEGQHLYLPGGSDPASVSPCLFQAVCTPK
ncbi:Zinc finger (C3HC4 RING finger) protein, related [Neospora caninum Liverpool]|uniref:Zinc finger (C3HC4 RING finger) protein, related n=1 Tax=Neospora caninum (strain Liverpool) TaxID=572307 RepID=F0VI66_NEOCL|nr:Zinc finger (C3HC4 RING finger) protein, related [Neospora caninum Liverpool]CBZ53427.1 Zinc finger (C3HC4 RING finger) protein, related [Neospora caninum Liverpool]|eukprot:XP_003883459.1 Zinc finger (C3HC4 RING finger) protein, related [Neospora caninum Liverpool]